MGRRVGFKPLWGDWAQRNWADNEVSKPMRVLVFPFWLWERAWYKPRPNTVDGKLRSVEWKIVKSQMRYVQSLFNYVGPPSHVLWNIKYPLFFTMLCAFLVTLWGHLRTTCCPGLMALDTTGVFLSCYRMAMFAMSLVLSLRISRAYDRWWLARMAIGGATSSATRLVMQACNYFKDPWLLEELARWANVWQYSMYALVTQSKELLPAGRALMDDEEFALYSRGPKSRQVVYVKLQQILAQAGLKEEENTNMDVNLLRIGVEADNVARFRFTALPYSLTLLSTGFIQIWLLFLPFGLWSEGYWFGLFPYFFVAALLLACDEVASQLEDPYSFLPVLDVLKVGTRDVRKVMEASVTLRKMADRPRAAVGYQRRSSHVEVKI